jgi:hypothetical protein
MSGSDVQREGILQAMPIMRPRPANRGFAVANLTARKRHDSYRIINNFKLPECSRFVHTALTDSRTVSLRNATVKIRPRSIDYIFQLRYEEARHRLARSLRWATAFMDQWLLPSPWAHELVSISLTLSIYTPVLAVADFARALFYCSASSLSDALSRRFFPASLALLRLFSAYSSRIYPKAVIL